MMALISMVVFFSISTLMRPCLSMTLSTREGSKYAHDYLKKFGYIKESSPKTGALISLESSVSQFQAFAGLPQTGELDNETMEMMMKRRCGVKDIADDNEVISRHNEDARSRKKRYALQGSRWKVKDLTYRVSKYPVESRLSRKQVDDVIKEAFQVWERETDLKFTKRNSGKVHIDIRFERRSHGDDDPFDGEGGTLAHAFFPVFGGDAHFDDEEDWTVNTARGTSLLMTAAHELGHSLGLSHSDVRSSLMAPFYRGYDSNLRLQADDIEGIQALYGDKTNTNSISTRTGTRKTTSPPRSTTESDSNRDNTELCKSDKLDTIVTLKNDVTYAFLGNKYWKLTDTTVSSGYPRLITEDWDGLPGSLDASFTWTNGKTYFFKGSKYWRFSEVGVMDAGYPKDLSKGFTGIPNDVDAAFVWPYNKKIYFFKGSIYWKFDPDSSPPVDSSYPRPISNWDGIPNDLDAALQYSNGKSYFFKNGRYYRFDDERFIVDDTANPSFPRQTGFWWFGCEANSVRLTLPEDVILD